MSTVVVFLVVGRSRAEYTFVPGHCSSVLSGRGSVAQALFPGAAMEIPGAGVKLGQLGADCCHLVKEVLDTLLKCTAVGAGTTLASFGCNETSMMRSAQRTAASENGLYVGG
jgi:hypothetical protein